MVLDLKRVALGGFAVEHPGHMDTAEELQRAVGRLEGKIGRVEAELSALRHTLDSLLLSLGGAARPANDPAHIQASMGGKQLQQPDRQHG